MTVAPELRAAALVAALAPEIVQLALDAEKAIPRDREGRALLIIFHEDAVPSWLSDAYGKSAWLTHVVAGIALGAAVDSFVRWGRG